MLSPRFVVMLAALMLCMTGACHRQSPADMMVGIWQFSGMDATMDYVVRADHTFDIWAPSMDVTQSRGSWLHMGVGTWRVEGDALILETEAPPQLVPDSTPFPKRVDKLKVRRFGRDRIEFIQEDPLSVQLLVEASNRSLQPTASRRLPSFHMTKTLPPAAKHALTRSG